MSLDFVKEHEKQLAFYKHFFLITRKAQGKYESVQTVRK